MSLQQKMKLQDLQQEIDSLSSPRYELVNSQIKNASNKITNDITNFFIKKGFNISGNMPKIKADYKGGLVTEIDFSNVIGEYIGCDGQVYFKYENKEFYIQYLVFRGEAPTISSFIGTPEEVLNKKMDFYENTLIPKLIKLGTADLTGEYKLWGRVAINSNRSFVGGEWSIKEFNSVEDALDDMIC